MAQDRSPGSRVGGLAFIACDADVGSFGGRERGGAEDVSGSGAAPCAEGRAHGHGGGGGGEQKEDQWMQLP
jgi:hypothetical protein